MQASVTMRDLLGWKSHGCPAAFLGAAVGETWVASKPGGLNVRNGDGLEKPAARSLFAEQFGKPTHGLDLGKADAVGEVTGRCTLTTRRDHGSSILGRLAEITSG